jgi:hypothetical protein
MRCTPKIKKNGGRIMLLIRLAIGTLAFALLGMAFSLAPAPNQNNPSTPFAVVMTR